MNAQKNRRGFTLVELSIVLVIIGLIIGGVLTGQQIIENARVTNTINSLQAYHAQFHTYVQNYGAMPGDDASATARFSSASLPSAGNGNGQIDGTGALDCTNGSSTNLVKDERCLAWAELRLAGLVKAQTPLTAQPSNPFGGLYSFQNGAFGVLNSTVLCLGNVPGDAALAIDSRSDDGKPNSGDYQATDTADTTAAPATSYDAAKTYILCTKI